MTHQQAEQLARDVAAHGNEHGLDQAGLVAWVESQEGMGACDYDEDGVQLFLGADNEHQPILHRDPSSGWVVSGL